MEGKSTLEEFGKNLGCFRFVVLEHQLPTESERPSHWDLLLEQPPAWGGLLLTFEVSKPPAEWGPPTTAIKLPDHRSLYLNYQGPISGNRGSVIRVLEGHTQWLEKSPEFLILRLQTALITSGNKAALGPLSVLEIRKNLVEANRDEWEMKLRPLDQGVWHALEP